MSDAIETQLGCAGFGGRDERVREMNQYPIMIGLVMALVMVCVLPNPLWAMVLVIGIGANGLVCAANEWKMPVRVKPWQPFDEGIRHARMGVDTRYKWLADVIPTGFGKASIGDIVLAAGAMGLIATRGRMPYAKVIAVLCVVWWGSGWAKGFSLFSKWTVEARRDAAKNIPITIVLLTLGNLLNVRGCGVGDMRASAESIADAITPEDRPKVDTSKWRDLGKLMAPAPELFRRLREDTAKRDRQETEKALNELLAKQIPALQTFTVNGQIYVSFSQPRPTLKAARSGPFCRVTCSAHHGAQYDVETLPEACKANWIPPTATNVPGWIAISDKEEQANPWPGPATAGFEKYKLYWSSLQSEAKVLHKSPGGSQ
jgi:uncharacterized membrane protein